MGDKYDRQLRLWGAEGQRLLAKTHVLVIGSCATASEALKNLVLPGVGQFLILDDANVSLADVTNNFFVAADTVGHSRSKTVANLLLEMNTDVKGESRHANVEQVLQDEPQFLDQFDLVLATQLDEIVTVKLAQLCLSKQIPLILVTSYGFLGSLRLQVVRHVITDAKLDPPRHDLRLSKPFPELEKFASSVDLDSLSTIEHAHVPFVVLLLQAMRKWKETHHGSFPITFAEKEAFKKNLQAMAWGPHGHEVNFLEAAENAYMAYMPSKVSDEVLWVLKAAPSHTISIQSLDKSRDIKEFWLLAHALADFIEQNDNLLPITGVLPDMTAMTDVYVALQEIYMNKAKEDAQKVHLILRKRLQNLQLADDSISIEKVMTFCKRAPSIGMLETRSVMQEYELVDLSSVDLQEEDKEQSPLIWYFMLRAVSAFASEFHRCPGSEDSTAVQDGTWLVSKAKQLATGSAVTDWITDNHVLEMTRSSEVELHNIAALMGGMAAQEAIKIITHQFEPLNHTYIFNGISGAAATYQL
ncbi:sumo-activating enzyme [Plasmopara halstedii]|uniref:NEDD8-activating enzyme E1 regulatory subunit n=1 Tax=Plasmopara halstedii TaxID=4781 RepID=A0A0P1AJ34_PLAHL|nr:sumo-activating enzyme [Plasmopara halstedii]CEG40943.1 sumo-activating enzyme [Plasmopara halstedii]|eukprot:XP_024577312.1 sumo-activating enzyme [Plasmopara halstedii]